MIMSINFLNIFSAVKANRRDNPSSSERFLIIPKSLSKFRTGAAESGKSLLDVIGALRSTIVLPPQLTDKSSAAASIFTPAELAKANASAAASVFTPTNN